ncbi:hypothetical protein D3C81_581620 [compost metagenome]
MIAQGEAIFNLNFGQTINTFTGQLAHKLLTIRHRIAALIVLIFIMHMAAQEAFGVTALGQ